MKNFILLGESKEDFFDLMDQYNEARNQKPLVNRGKPEPPEKDEDFMTQKQMAKFLKISLPTLIKWKRLKKIPYFQIRRTCLFRKSEVLAALRAE